MITVLIVGFKRVVVLS